MNHTESARFGGPSTTSGESTNAAVGWDTTSRNTVKKTFIVAQPARLEELGVLEDLDRLLENEGVDAVVLQGSGFEIPDIFWLTGFLSPDTIICLHNRGEETIVATGLNTLERVVKESRIRRTYDTSDIYVRYMVEGKRIADAPEWVFEPLLRDEFNGSVIAVPNHIPASTLVALQKMGYEVRVLPHIFEEARAVKSDDEVKTIRKAADATIEAVSKIVEVIKDSEIGANRRLEYEGSPLTVGRLKNMLDHTLIEKRAESAEDAIVAVGEKGYDFHYLGRPEDPVRADVPIIIDVFPRLKDLRYVADVTRTVVRGNVDNDLRRMFDAVKEASDAAADALRDGVRIQDVNMACFRALERYGYRAKLLDPKISEGMLHGLGHGIGLNVHELPSFYAKEGTFERGHVVAMEPGLYLKGIGGVRIENDYVVTESGAERLTVGLEDILFV